PYVGMPVEFIDMPSDEAEKLVDKDAINQDATDITDVIDPDSEMAIKMSECSSGSIESLDGCVIETKSTGAGRLSPAEVKKQCSQMGDIENDQAAKDAYNNCVNALSKVSTKGQSLDARKNAADYIYNTDLQVESMLSGDDEEDIVGNSGAGSNFRVATLNARGASHTDGAGAEDHLANNNSASRIKFTQNVIQSNNFDIIGFQELEPVQSKYLDKNLTGFDHTEKGKGADRIMWNTSRFTKTDEGTWKSTYFRGPIDEPWVKLQDNNTGQELYVMNVHDPINKGHGSAATRYSNALKHLAQVKLLSQNAPVVFTGDFNQGYVKGTGAGALSDAKTTYCVLVGDGTMSDTYDIVAGRDSGCPDNPKPRAKSAAAQIDHIYVSAGLTATSFDAIPRGYTSNGSDHPTVFSDISIPGGSTTSGSGGDLVGDYKEPSYAAIPSITVNNAPTSCSGKFTKGASSLSGIIKSRWSIIKSIGGYSCRANTANPNELSVHASGRALDIMVDGTTPAGLKAGNDIRNFLIGNAEKLGIQRVIWNRHIWSANKNGWQKYTGPSPHIDHVHAEINIQASKNANLGK
nr:endonuclease/exonuclease/phosphatase family protein [Candidatus Saccharibacteria bacterium]